MLQPVDRSGISFLITDWDRGSSLNGGCQPLGTNSSSWVTSQLTCPLFVGEGLHTHALLFAQVHERHPDPGSESTAGVPAVEKNYRFPFSGVSERMLSLCGQTI